MLAVYLRAHARMHTGEKLYQCNAYVRLLGTVLRCRECNIAFGINVGFAYEVGVVFGGIWFSYYMVYTG